MSLKPCPECRAPLASSATACPHCGYSLAAKNSFWWALAIVAVMVMAAVSVIGK